MDEEYIVDNNEENQLSPREEKNQRNVANNEDNLRAFADFTKDKGWGWVSAAGKAIDTADKISGGRSTHKLAKDLNRANKIAPGGRKAQRMLNRQAEHGVTKRYNQYKNIKQGNFNNDTDTKVKGTIETEKKPKTNITVFIIMIVAFLFLIIFVVLFLASGTSNGSGTVYGSNCSTVTVTGESAGTYSIDDYIAGVIAHEAYPDGGKEALKAQAIAARTYLINRTSDCTKSIENSESAQTFNPNPGEWAKEASQETTGMVLTYEGEVFSTMYDSFCYADSDCSDAVCNENGCTVEYTKLPNNEKHTITLKTSKQRERIVPGGGHAYGMSQLVSYEMAANGSTYEEILKYFYSEGVEISSMYGGSDGTLEEIDGFQARTSRATRDNKYFYGDNSYTEGECAWYGVRRTNEILGTLGKTERVSNGGNGGDFCYASDYSSFPKSYNIYDVRPGDVISWSSGSYGHVAIIEAVYRDSSGNPTKVLISEAYNKVGSGYNTYYTASNGKTYFVDNTSGVSIRDTAYTALRQELRKYNCEGPTGFGNGCQRYEEIDINNLAGRWGYRFVCYIHLVN